MLEDTAVDEVAGAAVQTAEGDEVRGGYGVEDELEKQVAIQERVLELESACLGGSGEGRKVGD